MLTWGELMKKLGVEPKPFENKSLSWYICTTCFHYKACLAVDAEDRMCDIKCEADCDNYLNANEFLKCINIVQFGKVF